MKSMELAALSLIVTCQLCYGYKDDVDDPSDMSKCMKNKKVEAKREYWIEQKLNHFDPLDRRKWLQRFLISDAFHKPGGPAVLIIGGETIFQRFYLKTNLLVIKLAKELNAMLFYLEHRFYGKSRPTADVSTESLRYLSSEQAIEDLAVFVQNVTAETKHRFQKWILFGTSYSGSLAVWTRLKFPHLAYAAVAISPPLEAKFNFREYMESVNQTLIKYGGPDCYQAIAVASEQTINFMKTYYGRRKLKRHFHLCDDLKPNAHSMGIFHSIMNNNIEGVVQFSVGNIMVGQPGTNYLRIEEMCDIMTNVSLGRELQRFSHLIAFRSNSTICVNANFASIAQSAGNETWGDESLTRAWFYQTCTEFGWFQTVVGAPFQPVPETFPRFLCRYLFGPEVNEQVMLNGPKRSNLMYGGLKVATAATRTVIANGGVDPWHRVSYSKPNVRIDDVSVQRFPQPFASEPEWRRDFLDPFGFSSIFVESSSHGAVALWDLPSDSVELQNARRAILALVNLWMVAGDE